MRKDWDSRQFAKNIESEQDKSDMSECPEDEEEGEGREEKDSKTKFCGWCCSEKFKTWNMRHLLKDLPEKCIYKNSSRNNFCF